MVRRAGAAYGKAVVPGMEAVHPSEIALEDAEELVARFSLSELRHERHIAEVHISADLEDAGYWRWYKLACDEAIDLVRLTTPTPTPRPGQIDIDAVRARADIVALAEGYGMGLRKVGRNFLALCPFHNEKTPSFTLYPEENRFHCFGCQADGDVFAFIMRMDKCDFRTAAEKAGRR